MMASLSVQTLFVLLVFVTASYCMIEEASAVEGQREFDYFALSLQWPGTYCRHTRHCCSKNACCRGANAPTEFTIHGLWPDYNDGTWPACCTQSDFNEKENHCQNYENACTLCNIPIENRKASFGLVMQGIGSDSYAMSLFLDMNNKVVVPGCIAWSADMGAFHALICIYDAITYFISVSILLLCPKYPNYFCNMQISTLHDALEKYWPSLSCGSPSSCRGTKGSFWAHEVVSTSDSV
ncbi:hypothetical protein NC652_033861 [Populus alba x Populus x berolinensis]|nr:hypothetical protein NC652_033861 [Populus alba x Populus x berolinensis]